MTRILAIGSYSDTDLAALKDMGAEHLPKLDDLGSADRAGVEGVAYKGHHPFGGAQMDLLPDLKVIANFGVGYDAIDIDAATTRGVTVTNTPDVLNDDVADLAVGMLIAQVRGFEPAMASVRSGEWASKGEQPLARKMSGRKVGILGLGRIGTEIAQRLVPFKGEIHYWSRSRKDTPGWTYHDDPVALARAVDDLIVAVVGGAETEGLVSAEVIGALGSDGVLVNIARGTVMDEEALITALQDGTIRAAALDVFRGEPNVDSRLAAMPNVLPLPHVGSATVETRAAMGALQRRNLQAVLAGETPPTAVNTVTA